MRHIDPALPWTPDWPINRSTTFHRHVHRSSFLFLPHPAPVWNPESIVHFFVDEAQEIRQGKEEGEICATDWKKSHSAPVDAAFVIAESSPRTRAARGLDSLHSPWPYRLGQLAGLPSTRVPRGRRNHSREREGGRERIKLWRIRIKNTFLCGARLSLRSFLPPPPGGSRMDYLEIYFFFCPLCTVVSCYIV